jgi:hypothetical protein
MQRENSFLSFDFQMTSVADLRPEKSPDETPVPFRFSLQTLFFIVTTFAVCFGILRAIGATAEGVAFYAIGFVPVAALSWLFIHGVARYPWDGAGSAWPIMLISTVVAGGVFGTLIIPLLGTFFGWGFAAGGVACTAPVLILLDMATRWRIPRVYVSAVLGASAGYFSASGFSVHALLDWRDSIIPACAAFVGAIHNGIVGWLVDRALQRTAAIQD